MHKWKEACKSFAPISYSENTRKQWFKKNQYRIDAAREIIEFVDSWVLHFRNRDDFEIYVVAAVREEVIASIRKAQQSIRSEKGILNDVKLSGFKTLVKWSDNPRELEKGPYKGSDVRPSEFVYTKSVRRNSKLEQNHPIVNLQSDIVVIERDKINMVISLLNAEKFPFQNVELELRLDNNLSVYSVEPYAWSPRDNRIRIGFIEASLDDSSHEVKINVQFIRRNNSEFYTVGGVLFFDDLMHGVKAEMNLKEILISF